MEKVTVGIDIGGTNTIGGLVDKSGKVISTGMVSTVAYPEIEKFVDALAAMISKLPGINDHSLVGVGIGAPNGNFHKGTIELAPNLAWKGIVPLANMVSKKLNIPVKLTNDANAAALGEMMFGAAKGMKDFAVLTLGTGLGSGIVVNGEVLYGSTGFAGEVGHTIVTPDGRDCGCGRQGCLETYVSATGLVRTAQWLMSEMNDPSALREIPPTGLSSHDIAKAAEKGDAIALQAFDHTAEILALAIVNLVAVSSPEAIFLFGGLANAGKLLFDPVNHYVDEMIQNIFKGTVKILPSGIPESNAAVLGSAALAWSYFS